MHACVCVCVCVYDEYKNIATLKSSDRTKHSVSE